MKLVKNEMPLRVYCTSTSALRLQNPISFSLQIKITCAWFCWLVGCGNWRGSWGSAGWAQRGKGQLRAPFPANGSSSQHNVLLLLSLSLLFWDSYYVCSVMLVGVTQVSEALLIFLHFLFLPPVSINWVISLDLSSSSLTLSLLNFCSNLSLSLCSKIFVSVIVLFRYRNCN